MQRMQRSFIKKVKERKERSILFIKNTKERENVAFFWKERLPNPSGSPCVFNQIEPNWHLPYSTMPVPLLRDATGRLGQLFQYMHEGNAESPKQGNKRFNSQGRLNTLPIWVHNLSMLQPLSLSFNTVL